MYFHFRTFCIDVYRFSGFFGPDNNGTYARADSSVLTVEKIPGALYSVTEMHSNKAVITLNATVTEVNVVKANDN